MAEVDKITGVVVDSFGTPVYGATVYVSTYDKKPIEDPDNKHKAKTDSEGKFTLLVKKDVDGNSVRAGEYISAKATGEGDARQKIDFSKAQQVKLYLGGKAKEGVLEQQEVQIVRTKKDECIKKNDGSLWSDKEQRCFSKEEIECRKNGGTWTQKVMKRMPDGSIDITPGFCTLPEKDVEIEVEKTWFQKNWWWVVGAGVVLTTGVIFLIARKKKNK